MSECKERTISEEELYNILTGITEEDIANCSDKKLNYSGKTLNFTGSCRDGVYLKEMIYNYPATIAFWSDGTKTVVKPYDDEYSVVGGLLGCFVKKFYGREDFNTFLNDWLPEEFVVEGNSIRVTLQDVMKKHKK